MSSNEVFEFAGFPGSIGRLLSNAAKSAGKAVGKASSSVVHATGKVTSAIGKLPVVGAPLKTIYNVSYHAATGPGKLVSDIARGKNVGKSMLNQVKTGVSDMKAVAPYAQMVVSCVPGIGTGISGALGAGIALANGQRIDQALLEGVKGALPGGPAARAALSGAVTGIRAAAEGKRLNFIDLGKSALGDALGPIAKGPAGAALMGGLTMAGQLAHGKRLDKALAEGAISALPVDVKVKDALKIATQASIQLAEGKRVDKALLSQLKAITPYLPIANDAKTQLALLTSGKNLPKGLSPEQALAAVLHSSVTDGVLNVAGKGLPADVKKALQTGLALGTATVNQSAKVTQLATPAVLNKLIESGVQLAKVDAVVQAARKLAGPGVRGFDLATGLTNARSDLFSITQLRESLNPAEKMAFDIGLSTKVGLVTQPKPKGLSAAAHAGHAIVSGMQGHEAKDKQAIMASLSKNPSAMAGASAAVKDIAKVREHWVRKVARALHLIPQAA